MEKLDEIKCKFAALNNFLNFLDEEQYSFLKTSTTKENERVDTRGFLVSPINHTLEVLIQERQHLQDKINNYKLTKANNQNKIDPLDLYFIEMGEGNESNNSGIKGLEEKLVP